MLLESGSRFLLYLSSSFRGENKIFIRKIRSYIQGRIKANFLNSELQLPSELSNSSIEMMAARCTKPSSVLVFIELL